MESSSSSSSSSWCPHLELEVLLSQPAKPLRRRYGSWAVVTGASDGIGRAFAFRLAASGLSLVLVGRNPDKLRGVAAAVRSRSPRVEVVEVVVDFAAPDLVEEGVRRLERAVAGLDIGLLVNSAGVSYPYARYFHEVDDDLLRTLVKVNVEGVTRVTQALLPAMLERKRGAIVNIGSGAAIVIPSDPLYAVFTEDDFVSISRIGDSKKQSQAWNTGRFGVGFNSVYHLTDLPSFVSGKYIVLFDPQGAYLPNVSSSNPGKRLDFVNPSAITLYRDQFLPYCAFGCDMTSPFSGTLFRFPLRSENQAAVSRLSRQSYLEDDIILLFSQLYEEAVFSVLFLKVYSQLKCIYGMLA